MPKVGKMRFPYTEQGMREAQKYSADSRKPMQIEKYQYGGSVPRPTMRPGMGRGLGRGMGQGLGGGLRRGAPQGMRQGMRPGMGQGPGRGMNPRTLQALAQGLQRRFKKGGKVKK